LLYNANVSEGNYIRQRRIDKGLSQTQLARLSGISRQRISDYESNRHVPGQRLMQRLSEILDPELSSPPQLQGSALKNTRPSPARLPYEKTFAASWERVRQTYWRTLQRIGFQRFPRWFCGGTPCDSALEYLAWALLVMAGALLVTASPLERGFRRHPLLDHLGWALGLQPRPCLCWRVGDLDCLIWPQISVQPANYPFRPDALALVCRGHQKLWCLLEIDGPLHSPQWDKNRDDEFKIPVLRFSAEVVKDLAFPAQLESNFLSLLA
jgi:transcriptional regulator with XRE-family HTH domain